MLGLLALLTCALIAVFAMATKRLAFAIGVELARPRASVAVGILLIAGALAPFCLGLVSYLGLYLCVWIAMVVAFALVAGLSNRSMLSANASALCFMLASSLLHFGYLSFTGPSNPGIFMRCLLVAGALALALVYLFALGSVLKGAYPKTKRADRALRPLSLFAYFAILYELLDLAPSQSDMQFELLPLILLGSTLLVTLACGTFAFVATRLGAEALREAENRALERKRKDQETRLRLYLAQASTDELTKLATRRAGQERLEELDAERRPYALAFIDVDGLKKINDEQGHLYGDEYLVACAVTLSTAFPSSMIVRWGGDEFLIIDDTLDREHLETRLAELEASGGDQPTPGRFSFGVAASSSDESSGTLERADEAMYAAKKRKKKLHTNGGDAL